MKKYGKAGLLIVTLVIPALVFTFLRYFTTNHYNIPRYHPVKDGNKVQVVGGDTVFYTVPKTEGVTIEGNLTVVSYFETPCVGSCVVMRDHLARIAAMKDQIPGFSLITVYDSTSQKEVVVQSMMGTGVEMTRTMRDSIFRWEELGSPKKLGMAGNRWLLVDREGHIRGYYDGADREETDRLMAELKILSFEEKHLNN